MNNNKKCALLALKPGIGILYAALEGAFQVGKSPTPHCAICLSLLKCCIGRAL